MEVGGRLLFNVLVKRNNRQVNPPFRWLDCWGPRAHESLIHTHQWSDLVFIFRGRLLLINMLPDYELKTPVRKEDTEHGTWDQAHHLWHAVVMWKPQGKGQWGTMRAPGQYIHMCRRFHVGLQMENGFIFRIIQCLHTTFYAACGYIFLFWELYMLN